MLICDVTDEEVMQVVFSMPSDKSPGPDGFTIDFFKGAWSVIGRDVIVPVHLFQIGVPPERCEFNDFGPYTPNKDAKTMKDYRPISCCNVLYKIVSKIRANQLKRILPAIIASNQYAFIRDRLLVENVLLASELVDDYHMDLQPPRSAIMIDIAKAFDTVQWGFLLNVLTALGMPAKFVFDDFAAASGLKISLEKSTIFMAGVSEENRNMIAERFTSPIGELPLLFRLPQSFVREVEGLCNSFLWSGPSLNVRKVKVAWIDVCKPKSEGGLGIRSVQEANKWVRHYLFRGNSFWALKPSQLHGSWIWRRLLKLRDVAKTMHCVKVQDGEEISFWHDHWSGLGCLIDLTGSMGLIAYGVFAYATLASVWRSHRRKHHRNDTLNLIEDEVWKVASQRTSGSDQALWRGKNNKYWKKFSSKQTWDIIRHHAPQRGWSPVGLVSPRYAEVCLHHMACYA
ncbi:uncharacterized protein LOC112083116 [Eutrema salsugineum]|uniref:uncharacterized protein LOC112083116 n=1 Tax=Eutrema salsugineum TaxID=72664 RepID=UPI000CECFA08|nr:uncharacterized protein LOC112083116 [Eutrema salsugineum]